MVKPHRLYDPKAAGIWVGRCTRCNRERWMTDSEYCPEFCGTCMRELDDLPEHQ